MQELHNLLSKGQQNARRLRQPVLVSVAQPLAYVPDYVQLFVGARRISEFGVLWVHPTEDFWIVGAGQAVEAKGTGDERFHQITTAHKGIIDSAFIEAPPQTGVGPVFVGGSRFDPQASKSAEWHGFPDALLALPQLVVSSIGQEVWVTVNVMIDPSSDIDGMETKLKAQWNELLEPMREVPSPRAKIVPDGDAYARWRQGVVETLAAIEEGRLTKATLAHTLRLTAETPLRLGAILRHLIAEQPNCRIFAIDREGSCFLGATPEQLVGLGNDAVIATCLAGSLRRGDSDEEDILLGRLLLGSNKELREHSIVVDWISERLGKLCRELRWNDAPQLIKLSSVQHLATTFTGQPSLDCHVLDLVAALHPTPAVGGTPLGPALEAIRRLEKRDRGWYAGPIGWVDRRGRGEFGVAIRSALVRGNGALLYAGAGIVSGSDPEREFEETSIKFKPLLSAIGVG